ncbi:hypothetical protein A5662_24655 [Mycobacteriaceae bacterium 1482268.1]|nr:hypothetical protein A5662_24655 [Mycobacteriaceae bacterium 1482268.1]
MTYSARLLSPGTRPTAQDFAGLATSETIWEDARWWRYTERTDLHQVRYLEVRHHDHAVALAPLLITTAPGGLLFYDPPRLAGTAGAMAEPDLLDPCDQLRWTELTAGLARSDQYPSLTLGTFGNHHGVVHAPGRSHEARSAVMAALPELLLQAAEDLGCRSVAMLYVGEPEAHDVDDAATRIGYQRTLLGAEAVHDLPATDWDGYLAGLSKRRRYQARKELRAYESGGYRTVVRVGREAFTEHLVGLQVAHRAKYGLPGGADRVRRDLDALRDDLGDSCVVLTAERGDEVASFTVYLRTRDALFARTGGTLPDARGCYFAVDYHETVRWALQNGIRRIHYGMAAYEAKITRGCELRPRWGWFSFGGGQTDMFREVLALQSKSMERQLDDVGYPAVSLPSQFALATDSKA